jgi:glyoxylase-like metal-dependent hydrolase (beta-lactamase superfamily II)
VLRQVAEGVLVHESGFCQSNAVVVPGRDGVLLVDAGVRDEEMVCLANDLAAAGQPVVAGFSTHPHWDHLLWHPGFGEVPRYATARCADTIRERLSPPGWEGRVRGMMPPEIVDDVPLDLLGDVTGLPAGTARIPWDGPPVRIVEHRAHAAGHAALVIEDRGVLVAGDMLSDILIPILDLTGAAEPVDDYLASLRLLEDLAGEVEVLIPGHGSVTGTDQMRVRIERDRAYVKALASGSDPGDPRIGPHDRQAERLGTES